MTDAAAANAEDFIRGTRLLRAGQCEDALTAFRAVYARAEAQGDADFMAAALCEIAWSCYRISDAEQGLECAMGAKWLWERLGNRLEMARAMAVESILFLELGFSDEAYDMSTKALEIAEADGDLAMLAFALNAKGIVLTVCRESELGAALVGRAVAIANQLSNPGAAAYYLLNLGFCHAKIAEEAEALDEPERAMGEREAALELNARAIESARSTGDAWTLRAALANNAEMLALQGRYDLALADMERCADLADKPGIGLQIHYFYTLGDVMFRAGRLDEALVNATAAVELADTTSLIDHQVNAVCKLAEILEAMGDLPTALAQFKRFHNLYVRQSGETAQRRARIAAIRSETELWRDRAAVLADQALSDPLTGIANRRSFDQILNRLAGTPFSTAIVDLDHFKTINDRFSHIVGDAVLQRVARTLVDQLGPHGHAARLGGEEFALVFPNVPEASAVAFCESIRISIAGTDWSDLGEDMKVTVSIGLSSGKGEEPSGLMMQIADNRLYLAKSNGRDCVVATDNLSAASDAERLSA